MKRESAYEMRPVPCSHCDAECFTPCGEPDCNSRLCENCMTACEGCGKKFCDGDLITTDDLPCCKACHVEYYADQMGEMEAA